MPRAAQLAGGIGIVYASLTAFWAIMLSIAGMSNFDAIAHAMTTIATGGYSTRTASIAAFDSVAIEWIVITGMIVGSLPFAHYLAIVRGDTRSTLDVLQLDGHVLEMVFIDVDVGVLLNQRDVTWRRRGVHRATGRPTPHDEPGDKGARGDSGNPYDESQRPAAIDEHVGEQGPAVVYDNHEQRRPAVDGVAR